MLYRKGLWILALVAILILPAFVMADGDNDKDDRKTFYPQGVWYLKSWEAVDGTMIRFPAVSLVILRTTPGRFAITGQSLEDVNPFGVAPFFVETTTKIPFVAELVRVGRRTFKVTSLQYFGDNKYDEDPDYDGTVFAQILRGKVTQTDRNTLVFEYKGTISVNPCYPYPIPLSVLECEDDKNWDPLDDPKPLPLDPDPDRVFSPIFKRLR